jgi:asparagine synthase (glutamine-hydrolysing)
MLSVIRYRGPDDEGIYLNNNIALGNVRLSIIDITGGHQPVSAHDGRYWIVINGEIFNYIELRQELIRAGHHFKTNSDTEVLLHAYIEYGSNCLGKLNGQFAFAIWDNVKEELFLARDRVGIRPLFYTQWKDTFVFGSEIKTILEYPGIKAELNIPSLYHVFTVWTAITPSTIFKGIKELPPGHYMKVRQGRREIKRFWELQFPSSPEKYFNGSFEDATAKLEELLTDAVRLRLRADVPVAAYLSGGLDSSTMVALIKKVEPDVLQTFSIGFEDAEYDETPYQQQMADYLGTRHTPFMCRNRDIADCFPDVVWHAEIPLLRTAPVPMYCLSQKVRKNNIKVIITGEGADETLAGYDIFKEVIIRKFWSKQPGSTFRPLLFSKLYPWLAQFKGRNKSMLRLFFGYRLGDTDSPFYSHLLRWHNTSGLQNYFSYDLKAAGRNHEHEKLVGRWLPEDFADYDSLSKAQWLEAFIFMTGYLLSSQGDRVAMANSVEGRFPFLDYRVIEFCNSLPPEFKLRGLNEKYILKKMMKDRLPADIIKRTKQPYRAPVASGLLTGNSLLDELTSEHEIKKTGIFDHIAVNKLIGKLRSGIPATENENMVLSGIISTQLLIHQFIYKNTKELKDVEAPASTNKIFK